jgi:flagellar hook protein FlgE
MNFGGTTQIASAFNVSSSSQNGTVAGTLTGVSVDSKGVISANYSNGSSTALGQVALATFNNPQGLSQLGGSNWGQSSASGAPIPGAAGSGQFGTIQSGAVEQSNVNLSEQLVDLITAQQAYQANSQSISAQNKMVETIMNAFR